MFRLSYDARAVVKRLARTRQQHSPRPPDTKNYLIGLTDRRLIVLQVKSMGNHQVTEVLDWALASLNPAMVQTSTGPIFTHIRIDDPQKPFVAKFHRAGMKTNREHCQAIAAAISQKQLAA